MRITDWIVGACMLTLAMSARSLGAENKITLNQEIDQIEQQLKSAQNSKSNNTWIELELFHHNLWRAMALDPSVVAAVPINQVPKNLYSDELNTELSKQLDALKKSTHAKEIILKEEFDQYIRLAEIMIHFRKIRQFPQARALAKRGALDEAYQALMIKFNSTPIKSDTIANSAYLAPLQNIREYVNAEEKEAPKTVAFTNGNKFIWFALTAVFGFFLGIAAYRSTPDFFQNFIKFAESAAQPATTHPGSQQKLDYARWLREFEEILSRLKSSQLTHERRIEDISIHSKKLTHQAQSLHADARIKNEANLEYRMSNLIREIQTQSEQSNKLRAGSRAQFHIMLEHCLHLCDAIETDSIHYDRKKAAKERDSMTTPPAMKTA